MDKDMKQNEEFYSTGEEISFSAEYFDEHKINTTKKKKAKKASHFIYLLCATLSAFVVFQVFPFHLGFIPQNQNTSNDIATDINTENKTNTETNNDELPNSSSSPNSEATNNASDQSEEVDNESTTPSENVTNITTNTHEKEAFKDLNQYTFNEFVDGPQSFYITGQPIIWNSEMGNLDFTFLTEDNMQEHFGQAPYTFSRVLTKDDNLMFFGIDHLYWISAQYIVENESDVVEPFIGYHAIGTTTSSTNPSINMSSSSGSAYVIATDEAIVFPDPELAAGELNGIPLNTIKSDNNLHIYEYCEYNNQTFYSFFVDGLRYLINTDDTTLDVESTENFTTNLSISERSSLE